MAAGRVNYGSWLFRIVAWDGLLPVSVALAPFVVESLLPNCRGAIEILGVLLPIAAFFLRFITGKRHIRSNHCSRMVQNVQFLVFCVGIFPLVLIDSFLVLVHVMPPGALFNQTIGRSFFVVVCVIYLTAMTIAMYPGRARAGDTGECSATRLSKGEWKWRGFED